MVEILFVLYMNLKAKKNNINYKVDFNYGYNLHD